MSVQRFGWIPDVPDKRDKVLRVSRGVRAAALPKSVSLADQLPEPYDQGDLGSCVANACCLAHWFAQAKQGEDAFAPSRLFTYWYARFRLAPWLVWSDSGSQIRDAMKSLNAEGVPPETLWPYRVSKFKKRPPRKVSAEAERHQSIVYSRVTRTLAAMRGCLAEGFPFAFGFTVYESFMSDAVAQSGRASMPKTDEPTLGGHAVLAIGYDDRSGRFLVRNSWGADWGQGGNFSLPYDYLLDPSLSDDLWTLRLVE